MLIILHKMDFYHPSTGRFFFSEAFRTDRVIHLFASIIFSCIPLYFLSYLFHFATGEAVNYHHHWLLCIIQTRHYGLHCMSCSCLKYGQRRNFLLNWTMKLFSLSSHCVELHVCMQVCVHWCVCVCVSFLDLYRLWVIEMVAQGHQYLRHPVWDIVGARQDARAEAEHAGMAPH